MKKCINPKAQKGFTTVELVTVIAVLVVLAAILIPTFITLNAKNNELAEVQEKTNKQLESLAEMINNRQSVSMADFEAELAEKLSELNTSAGVTDADIAAAISTALAEYEAKNQNSGGLTEDQVKAIVEGALKNQLTTAQVQAIVDAAIKEIKIPEVPVGLTAEDVEKIVGEAIKEVKIESGITAEELKRAIDDSVAAAFKNTEGAVSMEEVKAAINEAIENYSKNVLTPEQIEELVKQAIADIKP